MEERIEEKPDVVETTVVKKSDNGTLKFVYSVFVAFAVIFVFAVFFGRIVFFPIEVKGVSMQPTLNATSSAPAEKRDIVYLGSDRRIARGDIVVFDSGLKRNGVSEMYIKRVVALPGDTIEFKVTDSKNGFIYYSFVLNGIVQNEDYVLEGMRIYANTQDDNELAFLETYLQDGKKLTLGQDEYFLLGDNRNNSLDSRHLGAVEKSRFLGKVYLHIPYGQSIIQAIFEKIF